MFIPGVVRRTRRTNNMHWLRRSNTRNHDNQAHRSRNHTLCDIPPIKSVFQVTQEDLISSLIMAGYCRNMEEPVRRMKDWYNQWILLVSFNPLFVTVHFTQDFSWKRPKICIIYGVCCRDHVEIRCWLQHKNRMRNIPPKANGAFFSRDSQNLPPDEQFFILPT
jgi:hypothetical protein